MKLSYETFYLDRNMMIVTHMRLYIFHLIYKIYYRLDITT